MVGDCAEPLELDPLTLSERAIAVHQDRGAVDEVHVAVVAGDPPVTLLILPPPDRPREDGREP